jgi:hypothetical protein
MLKVLILFNVFLLIIANRSHAQDSVKWYTTYDPSVKTITIQTGTVICNSPWYEDTTIEKKYSVICSKYIYKYYNHKKSPLIYLAINTKSKDSLPYFLSYDNLMGYMYGATTKKGNNGIRITINTSKSTSAAVLKLLDYGINHLEKLKKIRRKTLKKDDDSTSEDLSINLKKINLIITNPLTEQMKAILNQ